MDKLESLTHICMHWPQLIRKKQRQFEQERNPLLKLATLASIVQLKIELMAMEEEWCKHVDLGFDYAVRA